jgi:sulfide:quinone oxidoreductase
LRPAIQVRPLSWRSMAPDSSAAAFDVVIAGGGVAGLEAALALRHLAGDRVNLTLLEPGSEFVSRAASVREPFSFARAERYPLDEIVRELDMEHVSDGLERVDPGARAAYTASGRSLRYDALMLAIGAQIHARYEHAVTIDGRHLEDLLHGVIQDIEGGYVSRLAFVAPLPMAWPLPIYELALMTARRAYDMNIELRVTVLTPEDAPLAVFGDGASKAVAQLLAEAGIDVVASAYCEVPQSGTIEISPGGRRLEVDRVIALPQLRGPALEGLPSNEDGFIPTDVHGQVLGVERVYAAGDATNYAVKHGGIAAQQADAAAEAIAALAGAPVEPEPFHPVIEGLLLTGDKPRYLRAHLTGGHGQVSEVAEEPLWTPPVKVAAKYLARYLDERG